MSAIQKRLITAALHGLDVIGSIARSVGGDKGSKAANAMTAIGAIVESVQAGFAREIDPAAVLKQIEEALAELEADLASNDAAANAALDAKFPAPGAPPVKTS